MFYEVNHLPIVAAIISRAVISRGWTSTNKNGANCQEVQIMMLGNNIYISGNKNEHTAIDDFLRSFPVTDINSFHECMSYCYWLIKYDWKKSKDDFGFNFVNAWGGSEVDAVNNFDPKTKFDLGVTEKTTATQLMKNAPPSNHTWTTPEKRLGWFMRRLTKDNGNPYAAPTPGGSLVVNSVNLTTSDKVYIIKNDWQNQVHAEINMLAALAEAIVANYGIVPNRDVLVGGLKRACNSCDNWMKKLKKFLHLQWKINIKIPDPEGRAQGGGAGYRPNSNVFGDNKVSTYASLLFNGSINTSITDVTAKENDYEWWTGGYPKKK